MPWHLDSSLLRQILAFLDEGCIATVLVYSIETNNSSLVCQLLYGAELWPFPICLHNALHRAAAVGSWRTVAWLLPQCKQKQDRLRWRTYSTIDLLNANSNFVAMENVHKLHPYVFPARVMYEAARYGRNGVVEWLHSTTDYEPEVAMEMAGQGGHLELVEWLYHHSVEQVKPDTPPNIILHIGLDLGLDVVSWMVTSNKRMARSRFCATRSGLFPCLPPLPASLSRRQAYPILAYAVAHGHRSLLEKIMTHPVVEYMTLEHALPIAAEEGHLEAVHWLLLQNEGVDEIPTAMLRAAERGHVGILEDLYKFLESRGELPGNLREQDQLRNAARNGHLDAVKYLVGRSVDITAQVFVGAAQGGHFSLVVWLASVVMHGSIPSSVLRAAVVGGNLELIRWLVLEHEQWYREVLVDAAMEDELDAVVWLYQHACKVARLQNMPLKSILELRFVSMSVIAQNSFRCAAWLLETFPLVDPAYSCRDLRHIQTLFSVNRTTPCGRSGTLGSLIDRRSLGDLALLVMAIIRHRPELARSIKWLPRWAVWNNSLVYLDALIKIDHPHVFTRSTALAVVTLTKNEQMMLRLLTNVRNLSTNRLVLKWAAKFQMNSLVDVMISNCRSSRQIDRVKTLRSLVWTAVQSNHIELVNLVKLEVDSYPLPIHIWHGLIQLGRRYNHIESVQLLEQIQCASMHYHH